MGVFAFGMAFGSACIFLLRSAAPDLMTRIGPRGNPPSQNVTVRTPNPAQRAPDLPAQLNRAPALASSTVQALADVHASVPPAGIAITGSASNAAANSAPPVAALRTAAGDVRPETAPAARRPELPRFRGSLEVHSTPEGGQVFLNGQVVGVTPLVLNDLAAGSRALRIVLEGHEAWSTGVQVVASRRTSVTAQLRPSPQSSGPDR